MVSGQLTPESGEGRRGPAEQPGRGAPLLRITGMSKTFGGAKVLDNVSLDVFPGEILAIVGQNGSGKSTLVKVLAGIHQPDPGSSIEVRDSNGRLLGSHGTHQPGLHFIHQDLGLLPMLSTTENLDLGRQLGAQGILPGRRSDEHKRAASLVGRFGAEIDVRAPVAELAPAERAIVAIARALDGWTRPDNVLILDEPTTAFHSDEVQRLFEAVRRVAAQGAGVIFISHRLDEVRTLADRVVALRDGKKVAEAGAVEFDDDSLVKAIVGAPLAQTRDPVPATPGPGVVLAVQDLSGQKLRRVSFSVRSGEILGIAGVLGSGREDLGGLLFGAISRTEGTVLVSGVPLAAGDMVSAIGRGVAFVPADRHRQGVVMDLSMRENLTLPGLGRPGRRFGRLDLKSERRESREWSAAVGLRPPEPERPLAKFSGGNQQKIALARWLRTGPRLLVLDEPTQGVDVGAQATIYELIKQAAADGAAVVVCSSDTKELAAICHRVLVMEGGQVAREVERGALSETALLRETLGTRGQAERAAAEADGEEGQATETFRAAPGGEMPDVPAWRTPSAMERMKRAASFRNASALYIFALLFVVFSLWEPATFLTSQTWRLLLDNQAITGMAAIALVVPLSAGVVDLAVGSEVGLGAVLVAWLLARPGLPVPLAIGLTVLAGAAIGLVVSLLIVRARIGSFIATLGLSSVLLAVIDWLSGSQQILNLGPGFQAIATSTLFGITYPVYALAVISVLVWYFLERTRSGRRVYATGGNAEAARLAGVRTSRVILLAAVSCGVIAAVAGILESAQLATGDPTISTSYLLPAFAAAFLGSTQFQGGRFNVLGTLVAVAVLAVGVQGLELAGAPVWLPNLFNGAALLLAVGFAQVQKAPTSRTAAIRRSLRHLGGARR
jgi:ABC-type sugar transport system ATPase subunit/ribose/xylose/arabinose/galactoside ABC-type transport system permease subunit